MELRSFLFVTWEGGGNVPPVLGLAKQLVQRGHKVRVLAEPCLQNQIKSIGAEYIAFKEYFVRTDRSIDLIQDWKAKPFTVPAIDNILVGPASSVARETTDALNTLDTDVLVADFMMPGALIAAEALGIKRIALFHMPEYFPGPGRPPGGFGLLPSSSSLGQMRDSLLAKLFYKVLSQYKNSLNEVRIEYGLNTYEDIIETFHQADLRMIQTSRAFDAPIDPAPENVRYIGPVLDDPGWTNAADFSHLEKETRPIVLVSLSSTFQNQKPTIDNIIKALSTLDVLGIVTLGPAMENEQFVRHDNILLLKSAPHNQILPYVSTIITHAGHGTVMRGLSFGKPLICMPFGRDQVDNAALAQHHGAGLKISKNASHKKIRIAVKQVLKDENFTTSAVKLAREIKRDVENKQGIKLLEAV